MKQKVTYRQQYTRCGKQRCRKCKEGPGHGPYWYAYWSSNGRTVSKYIGIHPPADLDPSKQVQDPFDTVHSVLAPGETTSPPEQTPRPKKALIEEPALRIFLLGQFRIERRKDDEWISVTTPTWQRRRARALLGCLLSANGRHMGREQAMEALWPDLDIDTASNRLNGAVHEVRQVLEPELTRPAASRLLRLEREMLILADASQIWVDADVFEARLNQTHTSNDPMQREQIIEEALKLYGGDYLLEELYSEWAAPRREALRRGWMGLLLELAELRAARGALTSAIEPLDRLLSSDPTHETAVRRLMVLLAQLDRRGEALRAYQRLVEALERDFESLPLPETQQLYQAMRTGTFETPPLPPISSHPALSIGHSDDALHEQPEIPFQLSFPRPALQLGRHNQSKLVGRERERELLHHFLLELEQLPHEQAPSRNIGASELSKLSAVQPETRGESTDSERGQATRNKEKIAHLLLLMGEPGIGKTRLAEELSYEANERGWSVVWAHAYEQEATIPYRPWSEIFRTLLKDIPPATLLRSLELHDHHSAKTAQKAPQAASSAQTRLARLSTLVPELELFEFTPFAPLLASHAQPFELERLHLWEAATAVLSVLSRAAPLLLVLDDLHWTDDSSIELLAYIVRHMRQERLAIVATCRDIELAPTSNLRTLISDLRREQAIITLPVQPLDETHIGTLVSHLPEQVIQTILTHAGGNPFFAEELARVSESGQPSTTSASSSIPPTPAMPETIMAVLERRLGRLSSDCQSLLGKVAVLGGSFEFHLVSYMTGEKAANEDALLDLLEEALRAGLLTEELRGTTVLYHFWHPLIVSHLYERLSGARRAQQHRRAAHALMRLYADNPSEVAAAITYHLARGGGEPAHMASYAELAGNRAYALSAYTDAEQYYRMAIEALAPGSFVMESDNLNSRPTVLDVLHLASLFERVAECNRIHGNFEEARRLYTRVLALRSFHLSRTGKPIEASEAQRQALIWREIGRAWGENGNYQQAQLCFQHARQVMIDAGVTTGAAWACILLSQGNLDWRTGQNDEARRHGLEALEMMQSAMLHEEQSSLEAAETELPTRTSLAVIGNPLELAHCHGLLGIVDATLSYNSEALRHLRLAQEIFERHDNVTDLTLIYGNMGAVYTTTADYATGRIFFQRALDMAKRSNNLPIISFVAGNLGDVEARCGNLHAAESWTRQSLEIAEQINDPEQESWAHILLGSVLLDLGRMDESLKHIRRGLAMGRALKSVLCVGYALVTLGEWRTTRAFDRSNLGLLDRNTMRQPGEHKRLLAQAKKALRRAIELDGLNMEIVTEGRLCLARAHFLLGEVEEAHAIASESLHNAESHDITRTIARARRLLGRIVALQEHFEEAEALFIQAIELFSRQGMRLDLARTLYSSGASLLQSSPTGSTAYLHCLDNLREARDIFQHCGAANDLAWVERILNSAQYARAGI